MGIVRRKVKFIEQSEHSECGITSVTMLLNYFGIHVSLNSLRDKYGVPKGGNTPEISLLEIKKGKDYRLFNKYRNTDGFREEYYFLCMDIQIFRINFLDFSPQKGHLLWYNDIEVRAAKSA